MVNGKQKEITGEGFGRRCRNHNGNEVGIYQVLEEGCRWIMGNLRSGSGVCQNNSAWRGVFGKERVWLRYWYLRIQQEF